MCCTLNCPFFFFSHHPGCVGLHLGHSFPISILIKEGTTVCSVNTISISKTTIFNIQGGLMGSFCQLRQCCVVIWEPGCLIRCHCNDIRGMFCQFWMAVRGVLAKKSSNGFKCLETKWMKPVWQLFCGCLFLGMDRFLSLLTSGSCCCSSFLHNTCSRPRAETTKADNANISV